MVPGYEADIKAAEQSDQGAATAQSLKDEDKVVRREAVDKQRAEQNKKSEAVRAQVLAIQEQVREVQPQSLGDDQDSIRAIFPDPVLARLIADVLGKPSVDVAVTYEELQRIGTLTYNGTDREKITSLIGMDLLHNLSTLSLPHNQIEDLEPIQPLMALQHLDLTDNKITDWEDLTVYLIHLRTLMLGKNQIEDITPLVNGQFMSLREVDLSANHITDLSRLDDLHWYCPLKLDITNQVYNESKKLPYAEQVVIANVLKDRTGNLIEPSRYTPTGSGHYEEGNIIWQLQLREGSERLTYEWEMNDSFEIRGGEDGDPLSIEVQFSGTFEATLEGAYPVRFVVEDALHAHLSAMRDVLVPVPTAPVKDGYSFIGWYTDAHGGKQWDFGRDAMPARELVLYARFVPKMYNVVYLVDYQVAKIAEVQFGAQLDVGEVQDKAGYVFTGWYTTQTGGEKWDFARDVMPARNLALYARFVPVANYKVIYVVDEDVLSINDAQVGEQLLAPDIVSKPGYIFTGWYNRHRGGEQWDFAHDEMPAHNLILYAQFRRAVLHQVIYLTDNGVHYIGQVEAGELLSPPESPSKEGMSFAGWYAAYTGGKRWDFTRDVMPAQTLILYAQYKEDVHTVQFNNDGVVSEDVLLHVGALVPLPVEPIKEGHTFEGWYTVEEGGRAWDFAKDVMPANDMILYARYTVNEYVVTFIDGSTSEGTRELVPFGTFVRAHAAWQKEGFIFTGWYTEAHGGWAWDFSNDTMPAGEVTLYARYEAIKGTPLNQLFPDPEVADLVGIMLNKPRADAIASQAELDTITVIDQYSDSESPIKSVQGFEYLRNLVILSLPGNEIADIRPLAGLTKLTELNLRFNYIVDVSPLTDMTQLTTLNLYNNEITDLMPLLSLSNVQKLNMSYNQIVDIRPLASMRQLQQLRIENNMINDMSPLKHVTALRFLYADAQRNETVPLLPYSEMIRVEHTMKGIDGNIAPIGIIRDNWVYEAPYVVWRVPAPAMAEQLKYYWGFSHSDVNSEIHYGGTYTIKVKPEQPYVVTFREADEEDKSFIVGAGHEIKSIWARGKVSYHFVGWFTAEAGGRKWDFAKDVMPANDLTLYARFEPNSYYVTYINESKRYNGPASHRFGERIFKPANPKKDGYVFVGWFSAEEGGRQWDFESDTMPGYDFTLYAQYRADNDTTIAESFHESVLVLEVART
jgi:uncharacterized repeat protein (TIGR02543 family)